jgi:tRNA pseudouridine55 synthase
MARKRKNEQNIHGVISVIKPKGITSRTVVDKVIQCTGTRKMGHTGTLDPLAVGVLVICIGDGTKLVEILQDQKKRYVGTFHFGKRSDTEDIDGEVEELTDPPIPDVAVLQETLDDFRGPIMQTPPAYSAVKVKGKRSYDLARKGIQVELKARPVTIHALELLSYEYPEFKLDIECSSGTYIRSLGRDIAQRLNTEAVMTSLERTQSGSFSIDQSVPLEKLSADSFDEYLLPIASALNYLPRIQICEEEVKELQNGIQIEVTSERIQANQQTDSSEEMLLAVNSSGLACSLLEKNRQGNWVIKRNFPSGLAASMG